MNIGVIGGSGLYRLQGFGEAEEIKVDTPFGSPSDSFFRVVIGGNGVFFLPRHGRGHTILPSELNHRANIFAMKLLGVEAVISVPAVGSLKEALRPRDVVLPDQYFDRTKQCDGHTFFGSGLVAHVGFGEPACPELRCALARAVERVLAADETGRDVKLHRTGTYVNMEGPAFSTKAESHFYRQMGFDVIGMTSLVEAKLCREAEICYQSLAMVTDYDCWREGEDDVTAESVGAHLAANTALAMDVLQAVLSEFPAERSCGCGSALASALMTDPAKVPPETLEKLRPLVGRYLA